MEKTVVFFNAGIGAAALAFQKENYNIIAAYEEDSRALEHYKKNISDNVFQKALKDIYEDEIPEADVFVSCLYKSPMLNAYRKNVESEELQWFSKIIEYKQPKIFCILTNRALVMSDEFNVFKDEHAKRGYSISYSVYDVKSMIGFPVKERQFYIIGILSGEGISVNLAGEYYGDFLKLDDFLESRIEQNISYYYKISPKYEKLVEGEDAFLTWTGRGYEERKEINWNFVEIPMVRQNNILRKMTHREVARLKGFSDEFKLIINDKRWLYRKLIFSPNVYALQYLVKSLNYMFASGEFGNSQEMNANRFEELFWNYLQCKVNAFAIAPENIKRNALVSDVQFDFAYFRAEANVYFELKFYSVNNAIENKVVKTCKRLSEQRQMDTDIMIFVIANPVERLLKEKCKERYNIIIWDIENLLWLFRDAPEIINEFVALLNYSVTDTLPKMPEENIFEEAETRSFGLELKNKLGKIVPGEENYRKYEDVCIEILQYVFGDYLTLWKKQQRSNQDLYRFDLYCKIKYGVNEEFFDTIKTFFGTKYVIFEFKNYVAPITQKEVYTTEKYLYEKALRKVAIVLSRKGPEENALVAARGCLRENGKLILFLSDNDLYELIDAKDRKEQTIASLLEDKLDNMLVVLEK